MPFSARSARGCESLAVMTLLTVQPGEPLNLVEPFRQCDKVGPPSRIRGSALGRRRDRIHRRAIFQYQQAALPCESLA